MLCWDYRAEEYSVFVIDLPVWPASQTETLYNIVMYLSLISLCVLPSVAYSTNSEQRCRLNPPCSVYC